jgi:hypothetical protein
MDGIIGGDVTSVMRDKSFGLTFIDYQLVLLLASRKGNSRKGNGLRAESTASALSHRIRILAGQ